MHNSLAGKQYLVKANLCVFDLFIFIILISSLLRQIVEWCVLPLTQVGCRAEEMAEEMAAVTGVETGA